MPFVPVPNTFEAEIRMLCAGQRIENTLYFRPQVEGDDPSLSNLGASLLIWWNTFYAVCIPTEVTLREIHITNLTTATSPIHTQPAPAPAPTGDRITPVLPNNATLAVSFRTGARGRSFRGRNYLAALAEGDVVESTVSAALQVDVLAAYNALLAPAISDNFQWVVVSRYSGVDAEGDPIPRTTGIATDVLSVVIVDPIVDSQRRRLPGRGN